MLLKRLIVLKKLFFVLAFSFSSMISIAQLGQLKGMEILNIGSINVQEDVYQQTIASNSIISQINTVSLKLVDFDFKNISQAFTITLPFEIDVYENSGNVITSAETGSLSVSWDPMGGDFSSKDVDVFVSSYATGKMDVRILVEDVDPSILPYLDNNVLLEAEIKVDRAYQIDATQDLNENAQINSNTQEIEFTWDPVLGAVEYELSYYFTPDGVTSNYVKAKGSPTKISEDLLTPAKKNAAKIVTNETSFSITESFEKGILWYAVRAVGRTSDGERKIYGDINWRANQKITFSEAYQKDRTWSYSALYSSESKKGESMTYVDPTGRVRQQVTKDWEHGHALVGEQFYGYLGEPMISVAPGVVPSKKMNFYENFTLNSSENLYNKENYATDDKLNNPDPINPKSNSGNDVHNNYFSTNNPFVGDGVHDYISDAQGYNFQQTVFNAQGKVAQVSGIGPEHKMGSGHEVEIYYATPSQNELDRLFGNEVADAKHYSSAITKNQDGQQSISYYNLAGQVIATGLVGTPGENLTELTTDKYQLCDENIQNLIETAELSDDHNGNEVFETVNNIYNKKEGDVEFNYTFDPATFDNCGAGVTCSYFVEVFITNALDASIVNLTTATGSQQKLIYHVVPNDNDPLTVDKIDVDFSAYLLERDYKVFKIIKRDLTNFKADYAAFEAQLRNPNYSCDDNWITYDAILTNLQAETPIDCKTTECDEYAEEMGIYLASYINSGKCEGSTSGITTLSPSTPVCKINGENAFELLIENPAYFTPISQGGEYNSEGINYMEGVELLDADDPRVGQILREYGIKSGSSGFKSFNYLAEELCSPKEGFNQSENRNPCDVSLENLKIDVSPGGQYFRNAVNESSPNAWLESAIESRGMEVEDIRFYTYAEEGVFSTEAQYFETINDLKDNWQLGFEQTLVDFHPEYCMIEWCDLTSGIVGYQNTILELTQSLNTSSELLSNYPIQYNSATNRFYLGSNVKNVISNPALGNQLLDPIHTSNINIGNSQFSNGYDIDFLAILQESITNLTSEQISQIGVSQGKNYLLQKALFTFNSERNNFIQKRKGDYIDEECVYSKTAISYDQSDFSNSPSDNANNLNTSDQNPANQVLHKTKGWVIRFPWMDVEQTQSAVLSNFENTTLEDIAYCQAKGSFTAGNTSDDFFGGSISGYNSISLYIKSSGETPKLIKTVTKSEWNTGGSASYNALEKFNKSDEFQIYTHTPDGIDDNESTYDLVATIDENDKVGTFAFISNTGVVLREVDGYSTCDESLYSTDIEDCACGAITNLQDLYAELNVIDPVLNPENYERIEDLEENGVDFTSETIFITTYLNSIVEKGYTFYTGDGLNMSNLTKTDVTESQVSSWIASCIANDVPYVKPQDRTDETVFGALLPLELDCYNYTSVCYLETYYSLELEAEALFNKQVNKKLSDFEFNYKENCIKKDNISETFTMKSNICEYNYTLYYYDVVGNLIATVYPEGVRILDQSEVIDVQNYRKDPSTGKAVHLYDNSQHVQTQINKFEYNTLGEVNYSESPDAGGVDYFYDNLGRLVASQNAEQKAYLPNDNQNHYSITKFDDLGRISEVGELEIDKAYPLTDAIVKGEDQMSFEGWLSLGRLKDVTKTWYDVPMPGASNLNNEFVQVGTGKQEYNRNRITGVTHYENGYNTPLDYTSGYFYRYNQHGLTTTHIQHNPDLAFSPEADEFKTNNYHFDLFSGLVNQVDYQPGKEDQLLTKFEYDKSGRLKSTYTSTNNVTWDLDAKNHYYLHGPKHRMEVGDHQIQGIDVVSTLAGLKGVNSNTLNARRDIGRDGVSFNEQANTNSQAKLHNQFARDAAGFVLKYYKNDYNPISQSSQQTSFEANDADVLNKTDYRELYSGQITGSSTAIRNLDQSSSSYLSPDVQYHTYKYDNAYNFIEQVVYKANSVVDNNSWNGAAFEGPSREQSSYFVNVSYDLNKNIKSLKRNRRYDGNIDSEKMDNFSYKYHYKNGTSSDELISNRLYHVHDNVNNPSHNSDGDFQADPTYTQDAQHASFNNYIASSNSEIYTSDWFENTGFVYNKLGQLTQNRAEGIEIDWTTTGKVKTITRLVRGANNQIDWVKTAQIKGDDLEFKYDAFGRRIVKIVKPRPETSSGSNQYAPAPQSEWEYTYYALDGNGVTQATYKHKFNHTDNHRNYNATSTIKINNLPPRTQDNQPPWIYISVHESGLGNDVICEMGMWGNSPEYLAQSIVDKINDYSASTGGPDFSAKMNTEVCPSCISITKPTRSDETNLSNTLKLSVFSNYADNQNNAISAAEEITPFQGGQTNQYDKVATKSTLEEHMLYADSRLGIWQHKQDLTGLNLDENQMQAHESINFNNFDPNNWYGAATLSASNGKLSVTTTSRWESAGTNISTVPGEKYKVKISVDNLSADQYLYAYAWNGSTALRKIELLGGNGDYTLDFIAQGNETRISLGRDAPTSYGQQEFTVNSIDVLKSKSFNAESNLGNKYFEFKNWLGSVISVFKDVKYLEKSNHDPYQLFTSFEGGDLADFKVTTHCEDYNCFAKSEEHPFEFKTSFEGNDLNKFKSTNHCSSEAYSCFMFKKNNAFTPFSGNYSIRLDPSNIQSNAIDAALISAPLEVEVEKDDKIILSAATLWEEDDNLSTQGMPGGITHSFRDESGDFLYYYDQQQNFVKAWHFSNAPKQAGWTEKVYINKTVPKLYDINENVYLGKIYFVAVPKVYKNHYDVTYFDDLNLTVNRSFKAYSGNSSLKLDPSQITPQDIQDGKPNYLTGALVDRTIKPGDHVVISAATLWDSDAAGSTAGVPGGISYSFRTSNTEILYYKKSIGNNEYEFEGTWNSAIAPAQNGWVYSEFVNVTVPDELYYSDDEGQTFSLYEGDVKLRCSPYVVYNKHDVTYYDDLKITITPQGENKYYMPVIVQSTDYYPYGMTMPGRNWTSATDKYRYGYQGSEINQETHGNSNQYTTHFRQLDARFGRWFSPDPVFQPHQSPYNSMDGNPINLTDVLGDKTAGNEGGWFKKLIGGFKKVVQVTNPSSMYWQNRRAAKKAKQIEEKIGADPGTVRYKYDEKSKKWTFRWAEAVYEGTYEIDDMGEFQGFQLDLITVRPRKETYSMTFWSYHGRMVLDGTQLALDVLGMIPIVGIIPDLINSGISGARAAHAFYTGDNRAGWGYMADMGMSLGAAIPFAGLAVGGTKIAIKGFKGVRNYGKTWKFVPRGLHSGIPIPKVKQLVPTKYRKFSKSNYRYNLKVKTGKVGKGYDAHHTIPKAKDIKRWVERRTKGKLNVNDPKHLVWRKAKKHRGTASSEHLKRWRDFKEAKPNATAEEIYNFRDKIEKEIWGNLGEIPTN